MSGDDELVVETIEALNSGMESIEQQIVDVCIHVKNMPYANARTLSHKERSRFIGRVNAMAEKESGVTYF